MKDKGIFRAILATFAGLMASPRAKHYPDPIIRSPENRRRKKRAHGVSSGRFRVERKKRRAYCNNGPGTIGYHDLLVRHFGRREADKYGRCIQAKQLDLLPTIEEFEANPIWAWRQ